MSRTTENEPRHGRCQFEGDEYIYFSYVPETLFLPNSLTKAERAITQLVAKGISNRDIAARRAVSVRTVENQLTSIFRKLGVASRAELLAKLFAA